MVQVSCLLLVTGKFNITIYRDETAGDAPRSPTNSDGSRFGYRFPTTTWDAFPSYRFFPAFFIRSAYAAVERTDAAFRMAAVHRGRLRTV
jgi:hypothetical protein